MKQIMFYSILLMLVVSCKETSSIEVIKLDSDRLEQIYANADTFYIDTAGRNNSSITATKYINRKTGDSTEILQDASKNILYIGQRKNGICVFAAEYYPTGQIQCSFNRDNAGLTHGLFKCYHEDGRIRIVGEYIHGKAAGEWKHYSPDGELTSIDKYENGIKQ